MSINIQSTDHRCTIPSLTLLIALVILHLGTHWPTRPAQANFDEAHLHTRCDHSEEIEMLGECIWGHIYYQGRPIEGAEVTLMYQGQQATTLTQMYPGDSIPYYKIRLPVKNGDLLTITAKFAKQTVTQSITIGTDLSIENGFILGLATRGQWKLWHLNVKQTNVLYTSSDDETLLAGSSHGLSIIPRDILSRMIYIEQYRFDDFWMENGNDIVRDIEMDIWGQIWVIGMEDIFVWQKESYWERMEDPLWMDVEWQTLIADQKRDMIWVGGRRTETNAVIGYLASYDSYTGKWTSYDSLDAPITALAIENDGDLWVGTWGAGIYQRSADGQWKHFLLEDGLPSNYIYTIHAQSSFFANNGSYESIPAAVWVGTGANGQGHQGGIGYYNLTDERWQIYNIEQGLPASTQITEKNQDNIGSATADVYTFLMTDDGLLWAGTEAGLYIFGNNSVGEERWVLHDEHLKQEIRALTLFNDTIIAATPDNLLRLSPTLFKDERPSISIVPSRRGDIMSAENQLPSYIDETDIIAWQWESDLDGLLCTTRNTCQLSDLSPGIHRLTLRLQTQYGTWTPPIATHITLGHTTYLPWFQRSISGK